MNIYANDLGLMTKMAPTSIYGKSLGNSSSQEPEGQ